MHIAHRRLHLRVTEEIPGDLQRAAGGDREAGESMSQIIWDEPGFSADRHTGLAADRAPRPVEAGQRAAAPPAGEDPFTLDLAASRFEQRQRRRQCQR